MKYIDKATMIFLAIGLLLPLANIYGAQLHSERHYQELAAKDLKGRSEVVLRDKTRVDILTKDVAYEVDFAAKWAEGIGQALHYSTMTERDAGLILIVEKETDYKHVKKVQNIMIMKSLRLILYVYDNQTKKLTRVDK